MASPAASHTAAPGQLGKILLILVALVAAYFIYDNAFRYFNWSEDAYGFYWQYRLPLICHITGGVIALMSGVWQLWTGLTRSNMKVHPLTGKIYVAGILLGSAGAIMLSLSTGTFGLTFGVALFCLAVLWLVTTGTAILCIRRKNVKLHQQWMTRSYILTFAFALFRIITDYIPYTDWWGVSREQVSNATIWAVWVIPWIGYEIFLSLRQLKRPA